MLSNIVPKSPMSSHSPPPLVRPLPVRLQPAGVQLQAPRGEHLVVLVMVVREVVEVVDVLEVVVVMWEVVVLLEEVAATCLM